MVNPFDQGYYTSEELETMGFKNIGDNVQIAKNCTIVGLQNISIKHNVRIDDGAQIICANGYLNIGKYVHICGNTLIACAGGVEINDFSSVAQGVRIYSRSDDFSGKTLTNGIVPSSLVKVVDKAITIDRHVIIGANAVILPGVSIGEGTAVGALSLIKDNLDAWSIYAGTPAKKINTRKKDLLEYEKLI